MTKQGLHIIIGLGKTGFSCAHYLLSRNIPFVVMDTRTCPPYLAELKALAPEIICYLGGLNEAVLQQAQMLVVSPGISIKEPAIAACLARGIAIIGDVELFAQEVKAPVIAITGTNAKGTVTTLLAAMAEKSHVNVITGGNIGTPVLNLLTLPLPEYYILELSSFQLETTYNLNPYASTILNISPDHMDRYSDISEYIAAKQRIYSHTQYAIYNRDDPATFPNLSQIQCISFGLSEPKANEFGIRYQAGKAYLAYGKQILLATDTMPIYGQHNWLNALAALALGHALRLPMQQMVNTLREYPGLPHRCQWLGVKHGVAWYNDSKGTNIGASLAAINGLGAAIKGRLILLAGGVGKGADFTALQGAVKRYVKSAILFGQDARLIAQALQSVTDVFLVDDLQAAVLLAKEKAQAEDAILLSPACASWDQFRDFEQRGERYAAYVQELLV